MKSKFLSNALLILVAIIWGSALVAQILGIRHVEPLTMNGLRFVVGALAVLPAMLILERGKSNREEKICTLKTSVAAGVILFTASTLQQYGIAYTKSAGLSGFITGLYTVLVPIAYFLFFRSKTRWNVWFGAISAIVGLFLLCYRSGEGLAFGLGEALLFVGSLFWAAHIILLDRMGKQVRSLHLAWGQYTVCAILGVIFMFLFEKPTLEGVFAAKWAILYCGLFSVGIGFTLQVVAQKNANPTFAAVVLSSEAVFSAVFGAIFGIDSISLIGYVGCGLMFIGILASQLNFEKHSKNKKQKIPSQKDNS